MWKNIVSFFFSIVLLVLSILFLIYPEWILKGDKLTKENLKYLQIVCSLGIIISCIFGIFGFTTWNPRARSFYNKG